MSINVSIRRDGEEWNENIDKLRIPSENNNSEDWISSEETEGKTRVKLTVGENGEYNASDFEAYGISEITVTHSAKKPVSEIDSTEMEEKQVPVVIAEGGMVRAMGRVKEVQVYDGNNNLQSLLPSNDIILKSLYVNQTGIYYAKNANAYGYNKVTVSLPSGGTSGNDHGWDEAYDGEGLPAYIKVIHNPNNMDYNDGDIINYTGLVVKAYKSNNTIWENEDYPNGIIPINELLLPRKFVSAVYRVDYKYHEHPAFAGVSPLLLTYAINAKRKLEYDSYNMNERLFIGYPYNNGGGYIIYDSRENLYYFSIDNNPGEKETGDGIELMHYELYIETETKEGVITKEEFYTEITDIDRYGRKYEKIKAYTGLYPHGGLSVSAIISPDLTPPGVQTHTIDNIYNNYVGYENGNINIIDSNSPSEFYDKFARLDWLYRYGGTGHKTTIPVAWDRVGDKEMLETEIELDIRENNA